MSKRKARDEKWNKKKRTPRLLHKGFLSLTEVKRDGPKGRLSQQKSEKKKRATPRRKVQMETRIYERGGVRTCRKRNLKGRGRIRNTVLEDQTPHKEGKARRGFLKINNETPGASAMQLEDRRRGGTTVGFSL